MSLWQQSIGMGYYLLFIIHHNLLLMNNKISLTLQQGVLLLILLLIFNALPARADFNHSPVTPDVPYEVRAVWLTTYMGLDWPRQAATTIKDTQRQKAELCQMLDKLHDAGINTVLFQSRLRGTTAYTSAIEPFDAVFTGHAGNHPSYDPLAFAVEECHKRGMELHAWVVAFPVCRLATVKQLGAKSLPKMHPELCQKCGEQYMMNPGVPEVADYLAEICREIVTNYDVDGIHLDYIRYPEQSVPFNDDQTFRKYGKGQSKAAWRAQNVDRCVKAVHDAVKAVRPWVKMSCSPVGKYSDLARYSSFGWNARDAVSQNAQLWLAKGWMDMLFPMMYFDGAHYYPFLANWHENDSGKPIVPGLGIWFLSKNEKDWPLITVQRQMNVARQAGLGGMCFFRTKFFLDNEKGIYDWTKNICFARPALVPPMTWADSLAPASPIVEQHLEGSMLQLSWQAITDATPIYYNVYRIDPDGSGTLLKTHLRETHYERLLTLPILRHSRYVVTAVDAYGNESHTVNE